MREFNFFYGIFRNFNDLIFVDDVATYTFKNLFFIRVTKLSENDLYGVKIHEPNGDVDSNSEYVCCTSLNVSLIMNAVQKI